MGKKFAIAQQRSCACCWSETKQLPQQREVMTSGREAVEAARELLDKQLQVAVPDGRVLTGRFSCLDKQGNLVLSGTTQVSPLGTERYLGVVVIPSSQRTTCELVD